MNEPIILQSKIYKKEVIQSSFIKKEEQSFDSKISKSNPFIFESKLNY